MASGARSIRKQAVEIVCNYHDEFAAHLNHNYEAGYAHDNPELVSRMIEAAIQYYRISVISGGVDDLEIAPRPKHARPSKTQAS